MMRASGGLDKGAGEGAAWLRVDEVEPLLLAVGHKERDGARREADGLAVCRGCDGKVGHLGDAKVLTLAAALHCEVYARVGKPRPVKVTRAALRVDLSLRDLDE